MNRERQRELTGIGHGDFANFIGEGEQWRRSLNVFFSFLFFRFFLFYFNSKLKKRKKKREQNGVVSSICNGSTNWAVTELWIDKNWKLEDWIDKTES